VVASVRVRGIGGGASWGGWIGGCCRIVGGLRTERSTRRLGGNGDGLLNASEALIVRLARFPRERLVA
jgi:hypothetical protein